MPSLHFILEVPVYLPKPSLLDPFINSESAGFSVLCEVCKNARGLHALLGPVQWSQVMLAFTVTVRERGSSLFKLTESKASGGVNYKLYGLLHFINSTLGS